MNISFQMKTRPSYIKPKQKKSKKLAFTLVIVVVIFLILSLVNGVSIGSVVAIGGGLGIFRTIYILKNYARRSDFISDSTEMALVKGQITKEQTILHYTQMDMKKGAWENVIYWIDNPSIELLEFCNNSGFLRICANIVRSVGEKRKIEKKEHYLYIEPGKEDEVLGYIRGVTNIPITFK